MISDLDAQLLSVADPASTGLVSTGTVISVDPVGHTVQVAIRGDTATAVTLPARADRYRPGGSCRVLHNPADRGRAVQVHGAVDPLPPTVLGTLVATGSAPTFLATVTVFDQTWSVQYMSGTYTVDAKVWVDLDGWGVPYRMNGLSPEATATPAPVPPDTGGGGTKTVQVQAVIGPQWSGTYRAGNWDRWNTGRYGGRSTLYQGNGFGSGPLVGLAVYGDQFANLGAISIDAIQIMARDVGLSGASGPATFIGAVQGTAAPAGGPTGTGPTFAGMGEVEVPAATREALRTGAAKGFATVGGNYWAVAGAGNGDGMVARVTYTRPA
jgi:hypothetical protein